MEANEFVQDSQFLVWRGSPLKQLHWLRIIIDEGHNVAGHSHNTNVVHLLDLIYVECRWVVSGTPSTRLCSVEVGLASQETQIGDTERPENVSSMLQSRKATGNAMVEESKDIDKLQLIVVGFLNLQPWSNSSADDRADWSKYIKPVGPYGKRRKSPSLRATLQSLVVRHSLDVIQQELPLPKLYNKAATSTRRKRAVEFCDIPWVELDVSQGTDGSKPNPKKRRSTKRYHNREWYHSGLGTRSIRSMDIEGFD
jgi:hypothetical protein